ncbi:hypothetical protein EPUS_07134 [Endocarpon pusillum Z07020]|uniref:Uncharacterized protein n=1 Tax=Endocarpon pusillum (strain Z07020 / HMAS-L-300199) TaxID=1263415 RepID=U1GAL3_ENDPU|nr:uncharacterized protein EPUS_07134 [Endocarpon pusillum Z07020]ERF68716.1 hypothetical protein EPUS_07134 [Endocarpon pusillum Z07020]
MHITTPSVILPLFLAFTVTTVMTQYPTTSPEEIIALKHFNAYPAADTPTVPPSNFEGTGTSTDLHLTKRRPRYKGILLCNQEHWKGNCWYAPQNGNACQNWDEIHSFGPDNGVNCDVFEGEDCKGKMVLKFVSYPGEEVTPAKSKLKSFRCGSH